jgi:hypothetical protein
MLVLFNVFKPMLLDGDEMVDKRMIELMSLDERDIMLEWC